MTKIDLPIQVECTVSGALGVVLRMSKILGLAPLKFKKVHDGWRIRISDAANLYGKIFISLNCFMMLYGLILDYNMEPHLSKYFKTSSDTAVCLATLTFLISSLIAAAATGICRMQCVITSLTHLEKVNTELSEYGPLTPFKTRILFISSFSSVLAVCVIFGWWYCSIFLILLLSNSNLWMHILDVSYYLSGIINKILILQVIVILATVPASFSHLNNCLSKLFRQTRLQYITYRPLEPTATVNHLRTMYNSLCDVVQNIDSCLGAVLVQIIPVFLASLVITSYKFVTDLLAGGLNIYDGTWQFIFITIHTTQLVVTVEPCYLTYKQMERTKHLISQLLLFTSPEDHEVIHELELFYKLLMKNVVYTPMSIFYLDRTLIVTIVASITTYLVIIVNL